MELLLEKVNQNIVETKRENTEEENILEISGTLAVANVQEQTIGLREQGQEQLRHIKVSVDAIRKVLRFYLGEWVTLQLKKNQLGEFDVKYIGRMF